MLLSSLILLAAQGGPVPYTSQADWESYTAGVTTGGAFADIDQDGFLDMVVANGNDISRQRVEVYFNDGQGNFPNNPQWQSSDLAYNGHLAVGDVDSDGYPEVAVSVFLGQGGFGSKGHVKLYDNVNGSLTSAPTWQSADTFYSFSCDFGDADGDGDLDLAVATGEPYFNPADKNRIYYNFGGSLHTAPGWLSFTSDHAMDVSFGDADGDGDLDLAFATASGPMKVFFQNGGNIGSSPSWTSSDNNNQNGNTCAWADVDADGYRELCVSDNSQLGGGAGVFKIYQNTGGSLATSPYWSEFEGYVSAVAFADVHLDGYPDLAGGEWWGGTKLYLNDAGSFPGHRDWQSSEASVVEALFFGDLRNLAVRNAVGESHAGNGARRVFYLEHAPAHRLLAVSRDGVLLPAAEYCYDLEDGWVALRNPPTSTLEVDYEWSESLDLGVTNWDTSIGNLVFLRAPVVRASAQPMGSTSLSPGDWLSFHGMATSTANRNETVTVAAVVQPPVGPYRILDVRPVSLTPFATVTTPYSFRVPVNLPPQFLGSYAMHFATVQHDNVLDVGEFGFTVN